MMEKESGSWNMLEQDFVTLERTLELVTGSSMVPCVGIGSCVLEQDGCMLEESLGSWNRLERDSRCWSVIFEVGIRL